MFGAMPGAEKALQVKNYPSRPLEGRAVYAIPIRFNDKQARGRAVLFADTSDLLVRKVRYEVAQPARKGRAARVPQIEMAFFYEKVTPNAEIADMVFTYTPPEGAKKVAHVKPVFDRVFQ